MSPPTFDELRAHARDLLEAFELAAPGLRALIVVVGPSNDDEKLRYASSSNLKPLDVAELCRELHAAHVAS